MRPNRNQSLPSSCNFHSVGRRIQDERPSVPAAHVHGDLRGTRLRTFSDNVVHRLVLLASQPLSLSPSLSLFLSLPPFDHLSRPHTRLAIRIFPSPLHRRSTSPHEQDEELQHPTGGRRLAIIAWTERFTPTSQSGESYKCSPRSSRRRSHLSRDHEAHPRRRCARVECVTPLFTLVTKFFFFFSTKRGRKKLDRDHGRW